MKQLLLVVFAALFTIIPNAVAQTSRTTRSRNAGTSSRNSNYGASSNGSTITIDLIGALRKASQNKDSKESQNSSKNSREHSVNNKDERKSSIFDELFDESLDNRTKKEESVQKDIDVTASSQQKPKQTKSADDISLVVDGEGQDKTEATKNALRSAIEQAFGTFVSASTSILDDEIVRDEIATVSSGNIKSFKELETTVLPNGQTSVTLKAVVSIGNLVSYAKAHGSSAEFAGKTFMMQMKLRELNRENEAKVLMQIVSRLSQSYDTFHDFSLEIGDPKLMTLYNDNGDHERYDGYWLPLAITVTPNNNYYAFMDYLMATLSSISLTQDEIADYLNNNYPVKSLSIDLPNKTGERHKSFSMRSNLSLIRFFQDCLTAYLNEFSHCIEIHVKGLEKVRFSFSPDFNRGTSLYGNRGGSQKYTEVQGGRFKLCLDPSPRLNNTKSNQLGLIPYVHTSSSYRRDFDYYRGYTAESFTLHTGLFCCKELGSPLEEIEGVEINNNRPKGKTLPGFFVDDTFFAAPITKKAEFVNDEWSPWEECNSTFYMNLASRSIFINSESEDNCHTWVDVETSELDAKGTIRAKYVYDRGAANQTIRFRTSQKGTKYVDVMKEGRNGTLVPKVTYELGTSRALPRIPHDESGQHTHMDKPSVPPEGTHPSTSHQDHERHVSNTQDAVSGKKAEYSVTILSDPYVDALPIKEMEPIGFNNADSAPRFNGGDLNEFKKWVNSILEYPEKEKNEGVQGRVYVQFTISSEGVVQDVKVKRSASSSLDAEAVRVISLSPKWIPATKDGYRIPVSIVFPVTFQLR